MADVLVKRKEAMSRIRAALVIGTRDEVKIRLIGTIPDLVKPEFTTLADHLKSQGLEVPPDEEGIPSCDELTYSSGFPHPDAEVMAFDILTTVLKQERSQDVRIAAVRAFAGDSMLMVLGMGILLSYRDDERIGTYVREVLREFSENRKLGGAYFLAAQRIAESALWFEEFDN